MDNGLGIVRLTLPRSDTCARLHDKYTGLYLYGDLYIADEFVLEMQNRQ